MFITPAEYERQLEGLEKALGRRKAVHINSPEEISRVRAVVTTWFEGLRPAATSQGVKTENLEAVDAPLRRCMELTLQRSPRNSYRASIRAASKQFKRLILLPLTTQTTTSSLGFSSELVAQKLSQVSPVLAAGYRQVHRDLADKGRLSYKGTANELRETLREVLERLAPDEQVRTQPWYKPLKERPTHQQRAQYILERRSVGSKVHDVASRSLSVVEEGLSHLVRDMFSRTAAAAHTTQDIEEMTRLVQYFDALICDLSG